MSTSEGSDASIGCGRRELELIEEIAIREFLHGDYPRLVAGVALVAGSRPAAEDAVQEALARAWERAERGEEIESLTAWVTAVSLNLARSRLRRVVAERRARERMGSRVGKTVTSPSDAGERVDVLRALASLPRRQREATVLRYYLGMKVAEVASALGIHEGTAKTTLFRARQALAAALGESDMEEASERGEA
ncbi:MAG: RNA polymerase sigma factor [Actinomycetota bacterium]